MKRQSRVHVRSRARGLDARTIRTRAAAMLAAGGVTNRELSILLCGDAEMAEMHETWLGRIGATDVLSFPQRGPLLGDVVLCVPVLRKNARKYGWSLLVEATRMLAHGILHLLGHDHDSRSAARRMEEAARTLLRAVDKAGRRAGRRGGS